MTVTAELRRIWSKHTVSAAHEKGKFMKRRAFAGKQGKDFLTKTLRCLLFGGSHGPSAHALPQFVFLFLAPFLLASNANAGLGDGLIAHWNYDDCTVTDVTGSGFNGTLFGDPLCVDGFQGKAFDFDAIDDHIRLDQSLNASSVRSISFWINSRGPDGINDAGVVLAKYSWFDKRSFLIYSHDGTTSNIRATFYGDGTSANNDTVFSYYENPELLDPDKFTVINNTKLNTDTWEHVVVNVTDTEIEIWINGQITNKVKRDYLAYFNSGEPTYIGNAFLIGPDFTFDFRLNGKLDDYRIYDRPLTEAEILELSLRTLSIHPSAGGDTGSVTAQIYGDGFQENATVKLVKTGEAEIVGSPVNVGAFGRTVTTTFDLVGKTRGLWDVVVENPDSTTAVLPDGFTIEEGSEPQLWVELLGFDRIRAGREQTYKLVFGNSGNIDIHDVLLQVILPPGVATRINFRDKDGLAAHQSFVMGDTFDTVIPVWLFTVDAQSVENLSLTVRMDDPPPSGVLSIQYSIGQVESELADTGDIAQFQTSPTLQMLGDSIHSTLENNGEIVSRDEVLDATTQTIGSTLEAVSPGLPVCTAILGLVGATIGGIITFPELIGVLPGAAFGLSVGNLCDSGLMVGNFQPMLIRGAVEQVLNVIFVQSFDPNDKSGRQGVGPERYVSGAIPQSYLIRFENLEDATAPAQEVIIEDQLDPGTVDLNTLGLGSINFGDREISPPQGVNTFATVVDLRPNKDLLVKVEGQLDGNTGLLTWRLTALDPDTGEIPEDPLAGFLPPNIVPPEGEGSVSFTVMPKAGLATNTEITNDASIIFDLNPPIETPVWSNLLDNTVPVSNVLPLNPTQSASDFLVEWTGMDEGAGISDFTVFVSEDGGPFEVAFANTPETSGAFSGEGGRTYDFYSIARDLTGNLEDAPVTPDASTTVLIDNNPPLANAGPDITVPEQRKKSALVQLDGTNSVDPDEPDDSIVSYLWFEDGVEIASGPSPQIIFERGQHLVSLIVEDTFGLEDSDDLIVTINKKNDDGSGPGPKPCNPNSPKCQSN